MCYHLQNFKLPNTICVIHSKAEKNNLSLLLLSIIIIPTLAQCVVKAQ